MVEVAIELAIDERQTTRSVLTILQGLDDSDTAAMATQGADCKLALIEDIVEWLTKHSAMEDDPVGYAILVDNRLKTVFHVVWMHTANDMEVDVATASLLIISAYSGHQPIEAVPLMYLSNADKM